MAFGFLVVMLLLIPFWFIMILRKRREDRDRTRLPPGPKKLPIIGNLHQLGGLPHRSLHGLSREFGPIMFLQLGSIPTLVVSSADIAKEIFKNHDQVFSSRPVLFAAKKLSYNCSDLTFAPYGEYWREMRKILVLELLSTKRVQSFEAIREQEVKLMVDLISSSSHKELIDLSQMTFLLTSNVVCRVAFGRREDKEMEREGKSKFHDILLETQHLLGEVNIADYLQWMWWWNKLNGFESRLEKIFKELDEFYDTVIQEHLDSKQSKDKHGQEDIVDVLLQIQKDPTRTSSLTNDQIKGILTDVFIGGTDTSSATLVWTMTELIKNPMAMEKAQKEVREVSKGKTKVDESDLPKLQYLKSVIKESLRLHPPAPLLVPRETTEKSTFRGYEIPAKTRVLISATSIGMDNKYWDNPSEFKPERFVEDESVVDVGGKNFELIPFGAGRRGCPGANFASLVVEIALANLLFSFDWSLPPGMKAEDIDMDEALGITMKKRTPLRLLASKA